tara:strand:- start:6016 stop:6543 length:528 start_codon:yes stop_codon:yes gene_type:complete
MELVKINKVKPNENNPRLIKDSKFKKLVTSIKEFPEMLKLRPIVVNKDMIVLGGNMRLKACKEAGLKEVYILKADDLTEEQQKEFIVKDNVGFGEWDWDILANQWDNVQLKDWGMDVWQPEEDEGYSPPDDPFTDTGVGYKSQYGVIVTCKSEKEQEEVFERLSAEGFECKIVVT